MKLENPIPEELAQLHTWRDNLTEMLEVVIPARGGDERFDWYESPCGTYRCLLGDAILHFEGREALDKFIDMWINLETFEPDQASFRLFGINSVLSLVIFGPSSQGTLSQRITRLEAHRSDIEQRIRDWVPVAVGVA